jgi:hypothetical protein
LISIAKLGVIIQGPINSRGRTMKNLTPRNFDASENINQLFHRIVQTGAYPILVTWDSEDTHKLDLKVVNDALKIRMPSTSRIFRLKNNIERNNKYKQFYSVLAGVEELHFRNYDYILKIRTDQDLPIEALINHIVQIDEKTIEERIFTPLLNLDKPNMFYDFYYFSTTTTMKKFHQIMMYSKEICSNVHFDAFYRWGLRNSKIRARYVFNIYPKYPKFTKKQVQLMHDIWEDGFNVLPIRSWRELIWRGEPFDETSVKSRFIFFEDNLEMRIKDVLSLTSNSRFRFEVTPIISFFISSHIEDRIRQTRLLLARARNKFKIIVLDKTERGN